MRITIITGGQTGVDRGAFRGAIDSGLDVGGYMPKNRRDELGLIPFSVRSKLVECPVDGLSARTTANVEMAQALLIVAEDREQPFVTPGTRHTWEMALKRKLPWVAVDAMNPRAVFEWLARHLVPHVKMTREGPKLAIMVAGPRASHWTRGESVAAEAVYDLGHRVSYYKDA
jgi:hypothetical protein